MIRWTIILVLLPALIRPIAPSAPQTDAVVGSGTAASCTETAFNTALSQVQASASGSISFNCGGAASITFSSSKVITKTVAVDGADLITLDGANSTRFFQVNSGGNLALGNITLTRGYSNTGDGGAVVVNAGGVLLLDHATIRNSNTTNPYSGGAIVNYGSLIIVDSLLENNTAGNGGALYLRFEAGDASITNSILRNNRTTSPTNGWGGGILLWDGADVVVNNVTFDGNQAISGGAINNQFAASTITAGQNTTFLNNVATQANGGAVYIWNSTANFNSVTFSGNDAVYGGGVDIQGFGSVVFSDVVFNNNSAVSGGAIFNSGTSLTLSNVLLSGNTARDDGGGIMNTEQIFLTNVTFAGNMATNGGGLSTAGPATTELRNVTFSGNFAFEQGGGLYSFLENTVLTNVTFFDNTSPDGNSLYAQPPVSIVLKNTILNAGSRPNCSGDGNIVSAGFNLSSDSSCGLNQAGDQINTSPRLGPLANYGGFTLTHLPRLNSPAINNGTSVGILNTDQRGLPRPSGGVVDIGAVERQPLDPEPPQLYLPLVIQ